MLAPGDQLSVAFAQTHLRLPPDGLDLGRELLQPELEMSADLRRVPIGPRALDERASGVGVAGLGDAALPPAVPSIYSVRLVNVDFRPA